MWLHRRVITRPTFALPALAVAGVVATALTGCSSGTNGQGTSGSGQATAAGTAAHTAPAGSTAAGTAASTPATATSPAASAPAAGATPTTVADLGAELLSGARSITSAHLDMKISVAGSTVHGWGVEKVSNGRLVAMDLTENVSNAVTLRIIIVGGKTYAKLPQQANPGGKPYVLVSPHSSDPTVRQFASLASSATGVGSVKMYGQFVRAAKTITVVGHDTVDGVGATHYTIDVDPTKIPNTSALSSQALAASGLKSIPLGLWVDDQGRPVKLTENLHVQGQTVTMLSLIGHYNQPVTITAPPAGQVSVK